MSHRFFLGIDAGGTKTHAVIAGQDGHILGAGRAGAGNWESAGLSGAGRVYTQALAGALAMAGLAVGALSGAGYGLSGVDWPSDTKRLGPVLRRLGVPGPHVLVNDAYVALRAGSDEGYGIATIAGTGCTVVGRNRAGEQFRTLALGNEWGDFGAASDVVRLATRAIAFAHLGRGPETRLSERFAEAYGADSVLDLVERITRRKADRPGGRLAPLVFATAADGDEVARAVLIAAGRELGQNAVAVARRLGLLAEPFDLVMAGGVFRASCPLFREALIETVRACAPLVRAAPLQAAPAIGGVLLAMDACGEPAGAEVRRRLIEQARRHPILFE